MDILSGQWRDSAKTPEFRILGLTPDGGETAPTAQADGKTGKTGANAKSGKAGAKGKKEARSETKRSPKHNNRQ